MSYHIGKVGAAVASTNGKPHRLRGVMWAMILEIKVGAKTPEVVINEGPSDRTPAPIVSKQ